MGQRSERERQQRRKYIKVIEAKRLLEKEELRAMEMLLDATWIPDRKFFVKVDRDMLVTKFTYFNRKGEVIEPAGKENEYETNFRNYRNSFLRHPRHQSHIRR